MGGWGSFRDKYIAPALSGGIVPEDIGETGQGIIDDLTGKTGEKAAERASMTQAGALMEQLDYLKEVNEMPQQYKEEALSHLSEMNAQGINQTEMIQRAKESPYYKAMIGNKAAGEEAVMRSASTTGGLRSGNVNEALYDYNVNLENTALSKSYDRQLDERNQQISGLQGLAGMNTGTREIGQVYSDIGEAKAAGIIGGAQSRQQGTQNIFNTGLGIAGLIL